MIAADRINAGLETARDVGRGALIVRLAIFVAVAGAVWFTIAGSWDAPDTVVLFAVVCGAGCVVVPDSAVGVTFSGTIVGSWLLRAPGGVDGWLVGTALGLLVVHVACAQAAAMPWSAAADGAVLRRWLPATAAIAVLTLVAALMLELLARADRPGALGITLAALGGVGALAWWWAAARVADPTSSRDES
ncbi:MAG: hypothetical protein H0V69_14400 [Acidimicrobiia bacterium]|jgi:hypothetical protein|nr:hypothetical protein [Acidimicrobiia bacterium]MDQ3391142.1 hypothetical protein [Actinomycetota bacterium]